MHTLRGVCPRLWSPSPAAAEAPRWVRSRGSHIDLADGLETGSPYFHLYSPGLALSRGGSLSCSSSPLSESALICSSFSPRRFICFVPSGSRVAEATMHFIRLWKLDIYLYIYIYIYIYCRKIYTIIYCIWQPRASWDTSQVRAQCLPLFLQGGWGGQLGLLGGAAPIVFQLLIRGMSLLVLARIGVRVTCPGRRRICGSIVFGQNALMQGLEVRPLWGWAVYTALHGARLSSVPSGDQSANPASVLGHSGLQGALLSVSSAQKCSGDGRLATPSGVSRAARSAVPCRSSVPGHRASRSKYTRGQSQETGSLSKSPGGVGALAKRVLLGSAWADSGS